jgi:hypothetical protein
MIAGGQQSQAQEKKKNSNMEGPRDMNMFQIEPSIIHERHYTRGDAERSQYIGKVLPAGAPIPDVDEPLAKQEKSVEKSQADTTPAQPAIAAPESISNSKSVSNNKSISNNKSTFYLNNKHMSPTLPAGAPIPDSQ